MTIRIGIFGYGNLGRGVEKAVNAASDMELAAVFSRRNPESITLESVGVPVVPAANMADWKDKIDVMVLCGGSASDLPHQTPECAELFNVIDSFDTHADIPLHFRDVDLASKRGGRISVISCGWDPGLFSLARLYFESVLPQGASYTFWGKGVSQGHSDAIRRIEGVLDARQYTVPVSSAVEAVKNGNTPVLTTREKHKRECFVAAAEGADKERIKREIITMPNYFSDYDTEVTFVSLEELHTHHSGLPHGGFVIRSGATGDSKHIAEFHLKLDSNPDFTGSVLVSCARAAYRLSEEGAVGCRTLMDIPPSYLSLFSADKLRSTLL